MKQQQYDELNKYGELKSFGAKCDSKLGGRTMKKIISIMLCIMLSVSMMTACGSKESDNDQKRCWF